ncbi:hypothetical protein [Psychrobacter sp. DM4]|uniref:hypothetical protein n=1 Tax=Psychrobacter sp. DM4 TaxID=3440637 RepID=UPI003F4FD651
MNKSTLKKYSFFYDLSVRKGVNHIFNEYLGFDDNSIVPVSVSHGVDFEHCYYPMDVYYPEPIHWAYNTRIFERARKTKPCLLMAHPWSIAVHKNNLLQGNGTLLIGPPPGITNDKLLYEKVKNDIDSDWSILIKGGVTESMRFWREKGVKPITAGNNSSDKFFYNLFHMLSNYENIVACTFSSAVIFAASIGKRITFIDGYRYVSYDTPEYLDIINFESDYSRFVVSEFFNNTQDSVTLLAKEILGFDLLPQRNRVKQDYFELLQEIDNPIFSRLENNSFLQYKAFLAKALNKRSLINKSFMDIIISTKNAVIDTKKFAMIKELDENSIWLNGKNDNNFSSFLVPYEKGVTIPGDAVDKY